MTSTNDLNQHFLRKALNLVLACGCTASEAHSLVDYVFGRPVGEKGQEVGGVRVTLSALCLAHEVDEDEAVTEVLGIKNREPGTSASGTPFQYRVRPWLIECFGPEIAGDKAERNHRFLEEALELVQACDFTAAEAHALVDYVYARSIGEKKQEAGAVRLTLSELCDANCIDDDGSAEKELARISRPEVVVRIREKQKRKPAMSALPGVYPERGSITPPEDERK